MQLRDLSFSDKLWAGTILVVLAALFVTSAGSQRRAGDAIADAAQVAQDYENLAALARRAKASTTVNLHQLVSPGLANEELPVRAYAAQVRAGLADAYRLQQGIDGVGGGRIQQASLARLAEARGTVNAALRRVEDLTLARDWAQRSAAVDAELRPAIKQYLSALDRFIGLQDARRETASQAAQRTRGGTVWIGLSALVFILALGGAAMALMARTIRASERAALARVPARPAAQPAPDGAAADPHDEQTDDAHFWAPGFAETGFADGAELQAAGPPEAPSAAPERASHGERGARGAQRHARPPRDEALPFQSTSS